MLGGLNAGRTPPAGGGHQAGIGPIPSRASRHPRTRAMPPRRGCGACGAVCGPKPGHTPPRGTAHRRGRAPIPSRQPRQPRARVGEVAVRHCARGPVPPSGGPSMRSHPYPGQCPCPQCMKRVLASLARFEAARGRGCIPICSAQACWVLTFPMLNVSEHSGTFPAHALMQALSAKRLTTMCLAVLAYGQGKLWCPVSHERRARTVPAWP